MKSPAPVIVKTLIGVVRHVERPKAPTVEDPDEDCG